MIIKEKPLGETFKYKGFILMIEPADNIRGCKECFFHKYFCSNRKTKRSEVCDNRKDGNSIIFFKVNQPKCHHK